MPANPHSSIDPSVLDGEAMLLAVYQAAERVTAELDLTRALEAIITCVRSPLGLERAGVFLYRRRRGDLIRLIGVALDGTLEYGQDAPISIADRKGPMQRVALGEIPYFHSHDVRWDVAPEVRMPPDLRAHAIVPLIDRGEIIGVMAVDNLPTGRDIPESMIRPLCLFGHFAALALGNALRAHDLGELSRKLHRLAEMTGTFCSILRPDPLLKHMLGDLPELLRADRYSAWRRTDQTWECVAIQGLSPEYTQVAAALYQRAEQRRSVVERLFRACEPVYLADVLASTSRALFAAAIEREGFQSFFGIPLCHGSELLGCVNLYYNEPPDLSEQEWEIARLFARQAGTALRNAELFEARSALDEQLRRINLELQEDRQLLLDRQEALKAGEEQKKRFYRDVLFCMTNGKIVLCDRDEIAQSWEAEVERTVIAGAADIKVCRDRVQECACAAGMNGERVHDLCLCTSEAATNALKHAGGGWLSVVTSGDVIRVRVSDQGRGIDALQLPHATLMRGYSTRASMGLGFTLIHEMSDRLCLASDPRGTTVIVEMAIHPEAELDRALSMLNSVEF
jgi:GAF domain-containing protein/anti-sigma regulatory factor (Ser/Thr protein kinase)